VITDGKDGFLVSQDPAEIADRILYLLDHPTEAAAMGQAGKARWKRSTLGPNWPKRPCRFIGMFADKPAWSRLYPSGCMAE
jgi:hypothetical protein